MHHPDVNQTKTLVHQTANARKPGKDVEKTINNIHMHNMAQFTGIIRTWILNPLKPSIIVQ